MPSDQQARNDAIDIRRSVVVEAGAGSGKTAILVNRILALLGSANNPEEVLAITFTRKATAEMQTRVLDALKRAESDEVAESEHEQTMFRLAKAANERDQERGWNLLENPSRLRIMTFDSLAHLIVRMAPISSKLGGPVTVSDDPEALYDTAVDRLFASLDGSTEEADAVFELLDRMDNRQPQARDFLKSLLRVRDQWLPYVIGAKDREAFYEIVNDSVDAVCADTAQAVTNAVERCNLAAALPQLWQYAWANSAQASAVRTLSDYTSMPTPGDAGGEFWRALASFLLTSKGGFRKSVTAREGFPAPSKLSGDEKDEAEQMKALFKGAGAELEGDAHALKALRQAAALPEKLDPNSRQAGLLDCLFRILPVLAGHLNIVFSEESEADHTHVFQAALQALGDPEAPNEASLILDYQLSHILVDEFQDTSLPQKRMLEQLIEGWTPGDGRTLFIVGDPKQSIYRFRDANIANFLEVRDHGIGDISLDYRQLTENFRSAAPIVHWNNETHSSAFGDTDDVAYGEIGFSYSTPAESADAVGVIKVRAFVGNDLTEGEQSEARGIAQTVRRCHEHDPEQSICILVRSRSHLRSIIPALREAGVVWKAPDIDPLSSLGVVSDIISLTRAVTNQADRLAWASLLRSPLVGLTVDEIDSVMGPEKPAWDGVLDAVKNDQNGMKERIERPAAVLSQVLSKHQRKPLRQLIEGAWIGLGGPSLTSGEAERKAVEETFELIDKNDEGGTLTDLASLEESLKSLYAPQANNAQAHTEVMTIHKSKGLQFDTVILPSLGKGSRSKEKALLQWHEWRDTAGHGHLLMAPIPAPGHGPSALYDHLHDRQKKMEHEESKRLLYVATTRAKRNLYLSFSTTCDKEGVAAHPPEGSLMGLIMGAVEEQVEYVRSAPTPHGSAVETGTGSNEIKTVDPHWRVDYQGMTSPVARFCGPESGFGADNQPILSWEKTVSQSVGTVFHRYLQFVIEEGAPLDSHTHTDRAFWERELRASGVPLSKMQSALQVLKECFAGLGTEASALLLQSRKRMLSEYPLTLVEDGETENLVIDLVIRGEDEVWIVDTKTSSPDNGQSESEFVSQQRENYRQKLEKYAKAAEATWGVKARTALFFPRIGQVAEVA